MGKRLALLLLLAPWVPSTAAADPLVVTAGNYTLDIEGDFFRFAGTGFALQTTELFISPAKVFAPQCFQCSPGQLVDWSFQTAGDQLLGRGDAEVGGIVATNVGFFGNLTFNTVPTPFPAAGNDLNVDFTAPFTFAALIRGVSNGQQLFSLSLTGRGTVRVDYEGGQAPGLFTEDDDTIPYEFAATPEPRTFLMLATGGGLLLRRRGYFSRSARI